MSREIPERDWKVFRTVREAALDRFCARVLEECEQVIGDRSLTHHQRYLRLYRLLADRDRDIASVFNDLRRSTAILQLAGIHALGAVTDEELDRFSPEVRDLVIGLAENSRR